MQRFHAAPEYFREARQVFHGGYFGPLLLQKLLGAARGLQRHAVLPQHLY